MKDTGQIQQSEDTAQVQEYILEWLEIKVKYMGR